MDTAAGGRWSLALLYFVACVLGHLRFSLWLVAKRSKVDGSTYAYTDWLTPALLLTAALVAVWVLWQAWRLSRIMPILGLWLLWGLGIGLIDRFLFYSLPEYIHYPQYALLAWLLAWAMDPQRTRQLVGRVLFWTTLLGMGDELLQYLWITTSYSEYLDFNDFVTNLLGAVAGVLLYYGRPLPRSVPEPLMQQRTRAVTEWAVVGVLVAALGLGLVSGRVVVTPTQTVPEGGFALREPDRWSTVTWHLQRTVPPRYGTWNRGPYRGRYWILEPVSGMSLLLLGGWLYAGALRAGLGRPRILSCVPAPHPAPST